jgi:hypothetical protein
MNAASAAAAVGEAVDKTERERTGTQSVLQDSRGTGSGDHPITYSKIS